MDHSDISKHIWTFFAWAAVAFAAFGVVIPLSLAFAPGVLSILAVAATGVAGTRDALIENKEMLLWIAGLCILCFFSAIFSIAPQESAERAAKITALIVFSAPLLVLAHNFPVVVKETFWRVFPMALIASGATLALELYNNLPLHKITGSKDDTFLSLYLLNKNVAAFTLLLPVAVYSSLKAGNRIPIVILGAIAAAIFFKTESQAAQCAMVVMVLAVAGALFFKRMFVHGVFTFAAFLLLAFPFFSQLAMDHLADYVSRYEQTVLGGATAAMRLENYSFISKRVLESPLTGHGIDTTRYMTFDTDEKYFPGNTILHPHNVYLQIWLEFGAYGVAFFLGILAFIWKNLRQDLGDTRILRVTFFCMVMVFLSISWSMWASWLVGMVIFFSAVVRLMSAQSDG